MMAPKQFCLKMKETMHFGETTKVPNGSLFCVVLSKATEVLCFRDWNDAFGHRCHILSCGTVSNAASSIVMLLIRGAGFSS